VLRRHVALLDFMMRAALGHSRWQPPAAERDATTERALAHWYRGLNRS
jgi:hypothetical protein